MFHDFFILPYSFSAFTITCRNTPLLRPSPSAISYSDEHKVAEAIDAYKKAIELEIPDFTTSLPISPHKNFNKISEIGSQIASKNHLNYLSIDFKKKDGYKKSIELSKEYKKSYFIYRVYDAKGLYPKFYRAAGCISDNFILDPGTYMARYKYS